MNQLPQAAAILFLMCMAGPAAICAEKVGTQDKATTSSALVHCSQLPQGELTEAELKELAPDDSMGRVRIAWKTESQENTYGFNILRADQKSGPYMPINGSIIPGEGTTNVPKSYCFEDTGVKRGQTYYYQIEEVTTIGEKNIVEGTAGTQVNVKTVSEEREWLKKKAAQATKKQ